MLIDNPRDVSKVNLLKIYLSKVCCFKLGQGPALMTSFNLDNYALLAFTISQLNLVPLFWRKRSATTKAALSGDSKFMRRGGIGQLHQRQTRQSDVEMHSPPPLSYFIPPIFLECQRYCGLCFGQRKNFNNWSNRQQTISLHKIPQKVHKMRRQALKL